MYDERRKPAGGKNIFSIAQVRILLFFYEHGIEMFECQLFFLASVHIAKPYNAFLRIDALHHGTAFGGCDPAACRRIFGPSGRFVFCAEFRIIQTAFRPVAETDDVERMIFIAYTLLLMGFLGKWIRMDFLKPA